MTDQLQRKNGALPRALVAVLAFVTTLVGSVVIFLSSGGGGTEGDTHDWVWIAPVIAALSVLVALAVHRLTGLRSVAWSIVVAAMVGLLCNVVFGLAATNLPSG